MQSTLGKMPFEQLANLTLIIASPPDQPDATQIHVEANGKKSTLTGRSVPSHLPEYRRQDLLDLFEEFLKSILRNAETTPTVPVFRTYTRLLDVFTSDDYLICQTIIGTPALVKDLQKAIESVFGLVTYSEEQADRFLEIGAHIIDFFENFEVPAAHWCTLYRDDDITQTAALRSTEGNAKLGELLVKHRSLLRELAVDDWRVLLKTPAIWSAFEHGLLKTSTDLHKLLQQATTKKFLRV